MHILFLSTWFPYPPDNGSKIRVYHLLRAVARAHDVTLVSFAFDTAQSRSCRSIPLSPTAPARYALFSQPAR